MSVATSLLAPRLPPRPVAKSGSAVGSGMGGIGVSELLTRLNCPPMQNDEAEITVHSPGHKGSHDAFVRQTPFRRCRTERSRKSPVGQARGGCVVDQIVEKV